MIGGEPCEKEETILGADGNLGAESDPDSINDPPDDPEDVDVDQSGLSKREWNELMVAFNLKDKLI